MPPPPAADDVSPLTLRNDAARSAIQDAMFALTLPRIRIIAAGHIMREAHIIFPKGQTSLKKRVICLTNHAFFMEAPPGFGPGNRGFAVLCLTTWLWRHITFAGCRARKCICWSGQRGSNSLPPPWQGGALPDELCPRRPRPGRGGASGRS